MTQPLFSNLDLKVEIYLELIKCKTNMQFLILFRGEFEYDLELKFDHNTTA